MGFFSSSTYTAPSPKLKETPWAPQLRAGLMSMLNSEFGGRNDADNLSYNLAMDFANGKGYNDPVSNPAYRSFRDEMARNTNSSASSMRAGFGNRGIRNSSMAFDQEASMRNDAANKVNNVLANMVNSEMDRNSLVNRYQLAASAANIDRNIAGNRMNIMSQLLNYQPWYQPQLVSDPSEFSQVASAVGGMGKGLGALLGAF